MGSAVLKVMGSDVLPGRPCNGRSLAFMFNLLAFTYLGARARAPTAIRNIRCFLCQLLLTLALWDMNSRTLANSLPLLNELLWLTSLQAVCWPATRP